MNLYLVKIWMEYKEYVLVKADNKILAKIKYQNTHPENAHYQIDVLDTIGDEPKKSKNEICIGTLTCTDCGQINDWNFGATEGKGEIYCLKCNAPLVINK